MFLAVGMCEMGTVLREMSECPFVGLRRALILRYFIMPMDMFLLFLKS